MKKLVLLIVLALGVSQLAISQDKKMSIGLGLGGSSAKSKGDAETDNGFGFAFYANAMYNVNERISAGIEYNSNAAIIGDINGASVEATAIRGILAKGKYRLGTGRTNFYGGLNAGVYIIQPGNITFDNANGEFDIVLEQKTTFGVAPEIGAHFGSFQIATAYHFAGKYEIADFSKNYSLWQFTIGWNIGILDN